VDGRVSPDTCSMSSRDFYQTSAGDHLVEAAYYPAQVVSFLEAESLFVAQLLDKCSLLIEVGSMWGRYLEFALQLKKSYIGVDVVPRYIRILQRRVEKIDIAGRIHMGYVCNVPQQEALYNLARPFCVEHRVLLVFPFNSIGNMLRLRNVARQLASLARCGASLCISTYRTSQYASAARRRYYENCSYRNVVSRKLRRGTLFRSAEGLRSMAYTADYIVRTFRGVGVEMKVMPLARIGAAYYFEPPSRYDTESATPTLAS